MKKRILGILVACLVLMSGPAFGVNTIKYVSPVVEITDIDSDWLYSTATFLGTTGRINIISIQFNPGAADDHCVILDTNAAGPAIFDVTSYDAYDQRIKYFQQPNPGFKPFLDYSAGTYSAGAKVIIILGE